MNINGNVYLKIDGHLRTDETTHLILCLRRENHYREVQNAIQNNFDSFEKSVFCTHIGCEYNENIMLLGRIHYFLDRVIKFHTKKKVIFSLLRK